VRFADAIDGAKRALDLAPTAEPELDAAFDEDERFFLQWLFRQGGLDVSRYRAETLARRLPALLRRLRVADVDLARAALEHDPHLIQDALSSMLIGVTSFFRDAGVFDELAGRVLPDLLSRRAHVAHRPLRVWSAGCSEGQELYSVAMLLMELGAHNDVELLGTDCRPDATRVAGQGIYQEPAVRMLSTERLHLHLDPLPDAATRGPVQTKRQWRIKEALRSMTRWRTADLTSMDEPGPWDLILCRNAAMYLRGDTAANLWSRLASALAPGGYMVLGRAERPIGATNLALFDQHLYRRPH
jgi:chemotaxis protein methyltransferase CheR